MAKLYFGFQLISSFLQPATDHVLEELNFAEDLLTLLTFNHRRLQINQAVVLANNEKNRRYKQHLQIAVNIYREL